MGALLIQPSQIVRRVSADLPHAFSPKLEDHEIIMHNVGFRPERSSGLRVERETLKRQQVVHAYGTFALDP